MKILFTSRAAQQIEAALDEIAALSPRGALSVRSRVVSVLSLLQTYPYAGRRTSKPNIRPIIVSPYPYLIDYSADSTAVVVRRFRHAARKPVA